MKPISTFRFFLLTRFSQPAADRDVYKMVRQLKAKSIVELGLGNGNRAETMIRVARKFSVTDTLRYTGIDLFEARENSQQKLTLKDMHRRIQTLGVKAQLVPGTAEMTIPRIANSHLRTDLIIISGDYAAEGLSECWTFLPRMLQAHSVVMIQSSADAKFQTLSRLDVEKRANASPQRTQRTAAAA
jgi:hypothetical protein